MDYFTDRKWMYEYKYKPTRCHPRFVGGVDFFIDYAKQQLGVQGNGVMRCPCWKCENSKFLECETIRAHIVLHGFVPMYGTWRHHGELPQRREIKIAVETGHNEEMATMSCRIIMPPKGEFMSVRHKRKWATTSARDPASPSPLARTSAAPSPSVRAPAMSSSDSVSIGPVPMEDMETQLPDWGVDGIEASQPQEPRVKRKVRATSFIPAKEATIVIKDGQMVSDAQHDLSYLIGTQIRGQLYFPLHLQWRDLTPNTFKEWFREINQKYKFVNDKAQPITKGVAMKALQPIVQKIIRDNRTSYKKQYYDGKTPEQLQDCPIEGMSPENWTLLVKYWDEVSKKEIDVKNKANRQLLKTTHTLGSKSFARFLEEERQAEGKNFVFLSSFLKAHKRKDGTYPDEETAALCEELVRSAVEQHVHNSMDPADLTPIIDRVFGHGGYERGLGNGAPPRRSAATRTPEYLALQEQLKKERQNNELLMDKMQLIETQLQELNRWRASVQIPAGLSNQ